MLFLLWWRRRQQRWRWRSWQQRYPVDPSYCRSQSIATQRCTHVWPWPNVMACGAAGGDDAAGDIGCSGLNTANHSNSQAMQRKNERKPCTPHATAAAAMSHHSRRTTFLSPPRWMWQSAGAAEWEETQPVLRRPPSCCIKRVHMGQPRTLLAHHLPQRAVCSATQQRTNATGKSMQQLGAHATLQLPRAVEHQHAPSVQAHEQTSKHPIRT